MKLRDADDLRAIRRAFLVGIPLAVSALGYYVAGLSGVVLVWVGAFALFAWLASQTIEMGPPWP